MLTWFQALYYLIILRILTADGDLAAISLLATLVEDEYPLTARHTIKRAFRDDYCLLRLSELQIQIVGLTGSDIARAAALEDEVDAEPTVSHLWINLANLQEIMLAILVEGGSQAGFHSVDVVFIHLCLHLVITEVIDDSYLLPRRDALSQLHIQQTDFTRDSAADIQFLLALSDELHIALHGFEVIIHLIHLRMAELCILLQSLVDESVLLHRQVIILLCLEVLLSGVELLLVESLLMLISTALGDDIL